VLFSTGSAGATLGGTDAGASNVISGNFFGVLIQTNGITVQGNRIGTNPSGTAAVPNNNSGVLIDFAKANNTLGGTAAGAGNLISGNRGDGVSDAGTNTVIAGNLIGTDLTGTKAVGNHTGVTEFGAGSTIGGTDSAARNVIAGNTAVEVDVPRSGNVVEGNYIGTDVTGTKAVGSNAIGVSVSANGNTIGGTGAGAGNLISGQADGVDLLPGTTGNLIQGNKIGTDVSGTQALGNIRGIFDRGAGNTIGGTADGAGNLISGNLNNGAELNGGVRFQGNTVGTDVSGTAPLGNGGVGVAVSGGNNLIGGTGSGAGNLISGNKTTGVLLASSGNLVQGNLIGTDATGTIALANPVGVTVTGPNNTIGGTDAGAGNVISGNRFDGVEIDNTTGNMVAGNLIGTDVTGTQRLGNGHFGVSINGAGGTNNLIGGTTTAARNVISGNGFGGVTLTTSAHGNTVQGNYLGTDVNGTSAIGDTTFGFGVSFQGANGNLIGGTAAGAGNVISGHNLGVLINSSSGNQIQGNLIGTDASGTVALGNLDGFLLGAGANGNLIGGTAAGAGNVISGNVNAGLLFNNNANGNKVQGNNIGTDITGAQALGNLISGVSISPGSNNNIIGGTDAGAGNLISGNQGDGIQITLGTGTVIQGNDIGTDASGSNALGNRNGISVLGANIIIGGTAGAGNLISGNREDGINASSVTNLAIQGNTIGTDVSGTVALGNGAAGIFFLGGSDVTIGGTTAGAGNLISGNHGDGITLSGGPNTTRIVIQGNTIGADVSGTVALGNGGNGVALLSSASGDTVGGMAAGAANRIAFNAGDGVLVDGGNRDAILHNSIFGNGHLGIELLHNGNNGQSAPTVTSAVTGGGITTIQGTFTGRPSTTYTLELFANDGPSDGQGKRFLGSFSVLTDPSGAATFMVSLGVEVTVGGTVTATLTDPLNNTSAFSLPRTVTG
jgi:titin